MIVFPNCKINLGLNITAKRSDGYHDIETVFFPVSLYDVLELIRKDPLNKEGVPANPVSLITSGVTIAGNPADNICSKAYYLLKQDFREQLSSVEVYLHKVLPVGAGIGGGSADGAFTLKLLNRLFNLGLSTTQLSGYALQLGSDCPFFLVNKPCFATGRGEVLQTTDLDLSGYKILLVNPGIPVSTGAAFAAIRAKTPVKSITKIIRQPVTTWKDELVNDFEDSVFARHPAIATIKKQLYDAGAVYASLSGSGSSVYGLFDKTNSVPVHFPAHYYVAISPGKL